MSDAPAAEPQSYYRILSIDGGGIRGVFPAAFLARIQESLEHPIANYFDLIAGTSTGGIIAIGLGLGIPAAEILRLYEQKGPRIFGQDRPPATNWLLQKAKWAKRLFGAKHSSKELRCALYRVLQDRRLGESQTRLVIPSWHAETERVYIYKTAHHERLENDYKQLALDAAMATAAAPTFLTPHLTSDEVELVDGGVWANNPIGVATIEAIGMLGWPCDRLKILSIGTITEVAARPRWGGLLPLVRHGYVTRLFMAGQSHSAMGTAKIITGDLHRRKAIWRIDQHAPEGRYALDNTALISEMKSRAHVEAREQLPELRRAFFYGTTEPLTPVYRLEAQT
jgi:uncharacterized protein